MNQFKYRKSTTCSNIKDLDFLFLLSFKNTINGYNMRFSQIYHIDEVTDA